MKIEAKALEVGFKFGAMATAIKVVAFLVLAFVFSEAGFMAAGFEDVRGSDFDKALSLTMDASQSFRVFGFFFFLSIFIYAVHHSKVRVSAWAPAVMFIAIPFVFMYVPGMLAGGEKYIYWSASALIAMLVYAGHDEASSKIRPWFYLFVLAFIFYGLQPIYTAWGKVVYDLGGEPSLIYFAVPALVMVGVLWFIHVVLVKRMVNALTEDAPSLSGSNTVHQPVHSSVE